MKVMVFGTFDGVHEGHRAFLREAKQFGDYLIVVVARDEIVEQLKGRKPKLPLAERIAVLKEEGGVDEVIEGDMELGTWKTLAAHKPDIIALGYDQQKLESHLEEYFEKAGWGVEMRSMHAHKPDALHNSILNN